ncbi:MAG TPA: hypothetical protein VGK30_13790 [Candidatus Binatia bacterium]
MVAVGEDATAATNRAVDGTGETRADRHHAASERVAVARLDDEMRVIALQRVVHEAKSLAGAALGEGALDGMDDPDGAKGRQTGHDTDGHVRRAGAAKVAARSMPNAGIRTRLAARVGSSAAPAAWSRQRKRELVIMTRHSIRATLAHLRHLSIYEGKSAWKASIAARAVDLRACVSASDAEIE